MTQGSLVGSPAPPDLEEAVVFYAHGGRKLLGTFWCEQVCFVSFLRHFSCPGCFAQAAAILPRVNELKRARVRTVLVGIGEVNRMLTFRERANLEDCDIDLVTDPTLQAHRAAMLPRSAGGTFGPSAVVTSAKLMFAGFRFPREQEDGDVLQQAGALLVGRGGRVLLHHVSRHVGDDIALDAVLERLSV